MPLLERFLTLHQNGMHPTAISVAFIENLAVITFLRGG